jgi:hypothetical protein
MFDHQQRGWRHTLASHGANGGQETHLMECHSTHCNDDDAAGDDQCWRGHPAWGLRTHEQNRTRVQIAPRYENEWLGALFGVNATRVDAETDMVGLDKRRGPRRNTRRHPTLSPCRALYLREHSESEWQKTHFHPVFAVILPIYQ